ncbi:acyl-CoA thioesterase [Plebeiibacterium marinum]|uniref:Acyl-CoA thioesterase n=1 Tax=Plebeiibacterium marinum TaxID=2992111 RepID=A0AAE3SKX5_9BACT|nr:thioesterase family protein [Plebeiobacterium marinum]MCW3807097.1 acyl-CoA thioesterase [Plebeiobacterium marinum]
MKNFFIQPVNIRYFDIDMNHHVNNSVYFTYMENARTELLMDDFLKYKKDGLTFVVSETSCKYKQPMRLGDHVVCELVFTQLREVQFLVEYTFKNADTGEIYAIGDTKIVKINEDKNRPVPLSKEFVENYMN